MAYDIGEVFQIIEEDMIASMSRNLKRHIEIENEEGLNYNMWQAEQLAALNNFRQNNKKLFGSYFSTINDKIGDVIKKANETGQLTQETAILEAIRDGFKLYDYTGGKAIKGQFFKINERKLNALITATKKDMAKAETAMLRMANDEYRKIIFNAEAYYNTGVGTLSQCVDMATKDFLSRGISCIQYANGARVGIDAYSRMAIRTAQTRAYLQGEAVKRDEWGVNTVIVNKRGVACPRCLKYVGQIFYDNVWGSSPVPSPAKYPLLSEAIEGGLYHPNCKDIHTTYFEGVSSEPKPMTQDQIDEANRVYALEQRQRYNERQIRKYKRLSMGTTDPETAAKYKDKLADWQDRQREFVRANSDVLKRRPELEKIFPEPPSLQSVNNSGENRDIIEHEHTWTEVITKHPTCTEKGEKKFICSCGKEKRESIPALGHKKAYKVIPPTCKDEGYTIVYCAHCGETIKDKTDIKPALGHDYGDWTITKQPTTTTIGKKTRVCKRCGYKQYYDIPKLKSATQTPAAKIIPADDISGSKSFIELKDRMEKKYKIHVSNDLGSLDFEAVKDGMCGIDRVFEEFPIARDCFTGMGTSASGSAIMNATYVGDINFNPVMHATKSAVSQTYRPTSFHPKNNNALGSAAHEAGHLLERALIDKYKGSVMDWRDCTYGTKVVDAAISSMRRADPALTKLSKSELMGTISGYAKTDGSECLAEAVCDYILNGEDAALLSQEIWEILKKELK